MIQSTAATLNFLGMLKLKQLIQKYSLTDYVNFINTVYDSVVIEFDRSIVDKLAAVIKMAYWDYLTKVMKEILGNGIVKSEFKYGKNWGETTVYDFK